MVKRFRINGPDKLRCPNHINPELEIVYVKSGKIEVEYERQKIVLEPGEASIVFPYSLHQFLPSEDVVAYVLMFSYEIYENTYEKYRNKLPSEYKFIFSPEATVYVDSLIRRRNELTDYDVKSLYYTCISAFFKQGNVWKDANNGLLKKIMDIVLNDELESVTTKSVAEKIGVKESLLTSYLKKQARIKFRDLVNGILLGKALELLVDRNLNITQVAIRSGFGSLRSFNRIFVELMGCTPTQYRKERKTIFCPK